MGAQGAAGGSQAPTAGMEPRATSGPRTARLPPAANGPGPGGTALKGVPAREAPPASSRAALGSLPQRLLPGNPGARLGGGKSTRETGHTQVRRQLCSAATRFPKAPS